MFINGTKINKSKLLSKDELLIHLNNHDACDRGLIDIRYQNHEQFGNELMWWYPISNGNHAGMAIVVVKEGFLCLPYHEIDKADYELFDLTSVELLDAESLENFISDWKAFSDNLVSAMMDMKRICAAESGSVSDAVIGTKVIITVQGGIVSGMFTNNPALYERVNISVLDNDIQDNDYWTNEKLLEKEMIENGTLTDLM